MDISTVDVIERIARVLAGQRISANAKGDARSAGALIDQAWPDYRQDALAVLRTMREPDRAMAAAGDPVVWERMIAAALGQAADQDRRAT